MQFQNLYSLVDLQEQFGPVIAANGGVALTSHDLVGTFYRELVAELVEITTYQWQNGIRRSAIKGFFLGGPPGVGKTSVVRRVAYELCRRFPAANGPNGESQVILALIDGGEIARARYGESEERIREVFKRAQQGIYGPDQRSVILFDDVESILTARGSENAKEWHFSQNNVFFHAVDDLDTSRTIVFLTSNRPDLVDEAILDRFPYYAFEVPPTDLLVEVAVRRAEEQQFSADQVARLIARVKQASGEGRLRSLREVERLVLRQYVEDVLGRQSAAWIGVRRDS